MFVIHDTVTAVTMTDSSKGRRQDPRKASSLQRRSPFSGTAPGSTGSCSFPGLRKTCRFVCCCLFCWVWVCCCCCGSCRCPRAPLVATLARKPIIHRGPELKPARYAHHPPLWTTKFCTWRTFLSSSRRSETASTRFAWHIVKPHGPHELSLTRPFKKPVWGPLSEST